MYNARVFYFYFPFLLFLSTTSFFLWFITRTECLWCKQEVCGETTGNWWAITAVYIYVYDMIYTGRYVKQT